MCWLFHRNIWCTHHFHYHLCRGCVVEWRSPSIPVFIEELSSCLSPHFWQSTMSFHQYWDPLVSGLCCIRWFVSMYGLSIPSQICSSGQLPAFPKRESHSEYYLLSYFQGSSQPSQPQCKLPVCSHCHYRIGTWFSCYLHCCADSMYMYDLDVRFVDWGRSVDGLELCFCHSDLIAWTSVELIAWLRVVGLKVPHGCLMLIDIEVGVLCEIVIGILVAHYLDYYEIK